MRANLVRTKQVQRHIQRNRVGLDHRGGGGSRRRLHHPVEDVGKSCWRVVNRADPSRTGTLDRDLLYLARYGQPIDDDIGLTGGSYLAKFAIDFTQITTSHDLGITRDTFPCNIRRSFDSQAIALLVYLFEEGLGFPGGGGFDIPFGVQFLNDDSYAFSSAGAEFRPGVRLAQGDWFLTVNCPSQQGHQAPAEIQQRAMYQRTVHSGHPGTMSGIQQRLKSLV